MAASQNIDPNAFEAFAVLCEDGSYWRKSKPAAGQGSGSASPRLTPDCIFLVRKVAEKTPPFRSGRARIVTVSVAANI